MRPRDARRILEEAESWMRDGLITVEQRTALERRYAERAGTKEETSLASILHALAGLVLGAAAIALAVLLDSGEVARTWLLLGSGAGFLLGGVGLARSGLAAGDALVVAGLVPITLAGMGAGIQPIAFAAAYAAPLGAVLARGRVAFVPPLAAIAFAVGTGLALASALERDWTAAWLAGLVLVATAATVRASTGLGWDAATAVLVVAIAVGAVALYSDLDLRWGDGGEEIFVALFMLVALAAGVAMRRRGLLVGATIAAAVDAVVFAFDVGGVLTGVVTLLVVAGAILAAAGALRRHFERA